MSSRIQRTVATLLLSSFVALTCPAASHALRESGRPSLDGPTVSGPETGILRFLLRLFGFAGGAMDPNG